ncbi:MAG: DUF2946 family protein [Hydrogenophaga sp.]|uniref:DUF2946 family protein n=1 Tax=Hydrogenophaga sp. TaxID=1904254 RepID=UPI001DEF7983|nr:DUF2946 family protein [Hydrogenophaga sp.]MBX3610729.1 DUF2946 family protein [Hydrogenophaga sp.]
MFAQRWLRRSTAWIALLAVCFGALAPTLSQAALKAHGADAAGWVQVCGASGLTWVRTDAGASGEEHPADGALICPWGVISAGAAGMPPVHALVLPETGPQAVPLAQAQRGQAVVRAEHASARAPPVGI